VDIGDGRGSLRGLARRLGPDVAGPSLQHLDIPPCSRGYAPLGQAALADQATPAHPQRWPPIFVRVLQSVSIFIDRRICRKPTDNMRRAGDYFDREAGVRVKNEYGAGLHSLQVLRRLQTSWFARSPSKMTSSRTDSCHSASELRARSSLFLTAFCIGVAACLVWQSYGDEARRMIANSYPRLDWLAPRPLSTAQNAPGIIGLAAPAAAPSFDHQQLNAMSLDAMRQSSDRITAGHEPGPMPVTSRWRSARIRPPPLPQGMPKTIFRPSERAMPKFASAFVKDMRRYAVIWLR
jgi:hypothetical protein